ncbi:glycosyltransferase [Hyphomicrobium sulfonivorans]|uniref:glycosyltransferase n=1 Tax=Hyphomicrobium sulfonivorans TaxID=121290 RepID=UPI00156EF8EB|nr:glycosyltransferase [Hyphomicrobium sulfonivorans]
MLSNSTRKSGGSTTGDSARVGTRAEADAEALQATRRRHLRTAVDALKQKNPAYSACYGLWPWQSLALLVMLVIASTGAIFAPEATLYALLAIMLVPFVCVVAVRVAALAHVCLHRPVQALPLPPADGELPLYTILVPLFRETAVIPGLVAALRALDYPADRLEIMLIAEEVDLDTQVALRRAKLDPHMQIVVVPGGEPRTKPRATQYALQFAKGAYVVVYDAEDEPEPDQLRRALSALQNGGERLGCVQARLNIHNSNLSWFSRQFTIEYTALFDAILPTLDRLRLPVPLGGTSNHFPRHVLDDVGGWDPYNVTEDADLGMRLARRGWDVGVIPSTTWEEAPTTFRVWKGQRTRWLKGWMQTYGVHMREPRVLWRELGARRFAGFQVLMGGMILSALVHPWFYLLLAFELWSGRMLTLPQGAVGQTLLGVGLLNLCVGYVSAIALGTVAAARRSRLDLAAHALMMPAYWLLISFAAHRALLELLWAPHYWEKTEHVGRVAPGQSQRVQSGAVMVKTAANVTSSERLASGDDHAAQAEIAVPVAGQREAVSGKETQRLL